MALGKAIEKQQAEIERMERFVERFRCKATKARQAQSRVKALDKIERIERDPRDNREMALSFGKAERSGARGLRARRRAHRGRPAAEVLLHDAELWLERGEHVSLVGAERHGQDDAHPRADRRAPARRRPAAAPATTSSSATCRQHAEELGDVGHGARRLLSATPGSRRTRRARCSGASCSAARRPRSRWPG